MSLQLPTKTPEIACFDFDGVLSISSWRVSDRPELLSARNESLRGQDNVPNAEVLDFARQLSRSGARLIVLSGAGYSSSSAVMRRWAPEDQPQTFFERMLMEHHKDGPVCFEHVGQRLLGAYDPSACLMIDDSERVIEAAAKAGWQTIHYST